MENLDKCNSLYIVGNTCTGKTTKVLDYLKENDYEYTYTSLNIIKNENGFELLLNSNNIINIFKKKNVEKVIVIDNIDYLQNSEKKLLNIIIKYLKNVKKNKVAITKKIIFVGINNYDKKVIELMNLVDNVVKFDKQITTNAVDKNTKETVYELLNNKDYDCNQIAEKTIISLIYHENMIYCKNLDYIFYENFLKLFSVGDYYDRISFQKQLWQFNEITFYLKVIENYTKYNELNITHKNKNIIFTKVLTKYSNEYSNLNFVIDHCNKLNCQKLELIEKINNKDILSLNSDVRLCKNLL